jgi:integrase
MARLTAIAVENLKPGPRRREIPDSGCRGLYLILQPTGRKSWAVRYRFQGTPRKLTLDGALTLAAARKAATDALHALERGHDPAVVKKSTKANAELAAANTLRAVAEMYLKREENKPADERLRTIDQRRATFERLIYPVLGHRSIGEIKRSEIVKLLDHIEAERGGRMADGVLGTLRILFDWHARRDDDFHTPVVRGMNLIKPKDRIRSRVLTDDELVRIWVAADSMGVFGRYVQFMLLTATRRNEAARMTHGEVSNGDWLIPTSRYKSKLDHLVPLSKAAQAVLAEVPRIASCDFVFSGDGKHPITGFTRMKAKFDAASGVTGWRLHDLRRTARSIMSAVGVNPDHAERCLGHALPGIRKIYDRYEFRSEKLHAFERLAAPERSPSPIPAAIAGCVAGIRKQSRGKLARAASAATGR